MSRELLLALDLGTSHARALVVDGAGEVRGRARLPVAMTHPRPGRVEQDPAALWETSVAVLRSALAEAKAGAQEVAALGVATQRASVLAWQRGGEPLVPLIGWQDQRTVGRAAEWRARGVPVGALVSATKLEWLLAHEAGVAAAARAGRLRFGTPDVWLTDRLTGGSAFVTDPGQASCTALYDLRRGDWNGRALALFGVPRETLPGVVATSEIVGETPAALLGAAVPVAARAGDQQAAAFGQGVHVPGEAKLTLGTSAMLDRHAGGMPPEPVPGAHPLALWRIGGEDAFGVEGVVVTAGSALDWLVEVGLLADAGSLDRVAASVNDAGGALFVPALQGLGTPHLEDAVRGVAAGLSRGTTPAHLARAALEGVAQRCADLCDALAVTGGPLRVDGGLARSGLLLQTVADLSGRAVARAAELETTGLGAAFLAGLAAGAIRDPAACRARLAAPVLVEPRLADAARRESRERWARTVEWARSKPD